MSVTTPRWRTVREGEESFANHGGFAQVPTRLIEHFLTDPRLDASTLKVYLYLAHKAHTKRRFVTDPLGYADIGAFSNFLSPPCAAP